MGNAVGSCVEKVCDPFSNKNSKGKYRTIEDKELNDLVQQTNKDTDDFFDDNIWWRKQSPVYIVPEKFIYLYKNYTEDQVALDNLWRRVNLDNLMKRDFKRIKNEALVYEWKYIIRKGVPFSKLRIVILEMFKRTYENNELDYESSLKVIFQEQVPMSFKNACTFADEDRLEDVLKINFLTDEGRYTVKKILWIFRKSFPKLDYCPMLPQALGLLLLFLSEAETYTVTKLMLEESVRLLDESIQYAAEEMKGLRWHFTLNKEDFEKFIKSFYNYVLKKSKAFVEIEKHLTSINYNYVELFSDWFKNLFFGFLPLPIVVRIFATFLNEGIKIYYRMGYALLRIFRKDVLAHTDPTTLTAFLRDKANNITEEQIKKMMKKAYGLALPALDHRFSKVQVETEDLTTTNMYYLPHVSVPSTMIKNEQFETLWEWLPQEYKLSDPTLVYSMNKHGASIKTLYAKTEAYKGYSMIIIIKSDKNTIFGAFIDQVFKPDWTGIKYTGSDECFVFSLFPQEAKFAASKKNSDHLVCAGDYISIGNGGDGPAIYLDEELNNGQTYKCDTYNNPQLNGLDGKANSAFRCLNLEVYVVN